MSIVLGAAREKLNLKVTIKKLNTNKGIDYPKFKFSHHLLMVMMFQTYTTFSSVEYKDDFFCL